MLKGLPATTGDGAHLAEAQTQPDRYFQEVGTLGYACCCPYAPLSSAAKSQGRPDQVQIGMNISPAGLEPVRQCVRLRVHGKARTPLQPLRGQEALR